MKALNKSNHSKYTYEAKLVPLGEHALAVMTKMTLAVQFMASVDRQDAAPEVPRRRDTTY